MRWLHRNLIRLVLVFLASAAPAAAADSLQLLLVDTTVNFVPQGEAVLLWNGEDRFYAGEAELRKWRVRPPYPEPVLRDGKAYIPIDDISGAEVDFNLRRLTVNVTLPPRSLLTQVRRAVRAEPPEPTASTGVFVDYDLGYTDDSYARYATAFIAPTFFAPAGSFHNQFLYRGFESGFAGPDQGDDWLRLETTFTRDDPDNIRSYAAGDVISAAGPWGGAYRMGGLQVASNFATRPAMTTFPVPSLNGAAMTPSSVDLYVNGVLQQRKSVDSGFFQVDDIPVITGSGELKMVVRDIMGREQILYQDFYASSELLRRGLSDYSYSLGYLRRNYAIESNDYGPLAFVGAHRVGINEGWTAGGRLEATDDVQIVAASSDLALGINGVLSGGAGLSRSDAGTGNTWLLGYEYLNSDFHIGGQVTGQSARMATLDPLLSVYPTKLQMLVSGGFNKGIIGSVGASFVHQSFHGLPGRNIFSAHYNLNVNYDNYVSLFASYVDGVESDYTVGLMWTRNFGDRGSTSSSATRQADRTQVRLESQYSLPVGPGIGYRIGATIDDDTQLDGTFIGQTDYGRYTFDAKKHRDGASWRVGALGSLIWMAGRPYAAREINEGFAVAKIADYENVRVYLENQEIGRTDSRGRIMLPALRPYETNRVRIEPRDLPLGAQIDSLTMEIAPYYRSGAVVEFPVSRLRQAVLTVYDETGAPLPTGAVARIVGQDRTFAVGLNGLVYLTGLGESSTVVVAWQGRQCTFEVASPAGTEALPNLGQFVCAEQ